MSARRARPGAWPRYRRSTPTAPRRSRLTRSGPQSGGALTRPARSREQPGMTDGQPVIAVLGLGEAGSRIAADLAAAGAVVRGYDPVVKAVQDITDCASEADACRGA